MPPHPHDDLYAQRAQAARQREIEASTRSRNISRARLLTFLPGAVALALALLNPAEATPWHWAIAAAGLTLFAWLVRWHEPVERQRRRAAAEREVNERARHRLARRFSELPVVEFPTWATERPTARDLNLFGHASVSQWLGSVATPAGRETLARWLSAGAEPGEIRARQEAVLELAPAIDSRQRFEVEALPLVRTALAVEQFVAWAASPPWIERHRVARIAAHAGWSASALAFLLAALGFVPIQLWFLVLVVNFAWTWLLKKDLSLATAEMSERQEAFAGYAALLRIVAGWSFASPRLRAIAARLASSGLDAAAELDRLRRLSELADARRSSVHALLQAACAWDVLLLGRVAAWQRRAGRFAGEWLAAAGELEVLAAFAGARFDQPEWAMPRVDSAHDRLRAEALAHPLLADGARVGNDVEVGPRGKFLLVTGSNMSGKSTLLRAIGVNAVLAQAGAPVCATSFAMPPFEVETSGRVDDSLAEGVSFYLAELQRLKAIVERAATPQGPRVLFLLDELLRGTNSDERRIAVASIVRRLLDSGATGALSTHDLELAAVPSLRGRFHAGHFRDTLDAVDGVAELRFDYLLREGLATTTNALVLLRLVGLGEALPSAP